MNTEAITERSMFGMHKGTQGIHLRLRLTACDKKKKNETSPLMSATSITKQSAWICFTACVVVTNDMISSAPQFQRDSVSDGWITGRPNLTTFVLVKSSRSGSVIYCLRRVSALLAARITTVSLDKCSVSYIPPPSMVWLDSHTC